MKAILKISAIKELTPDVLQIQLQKTAPISYEPGQAANVSINSPGWEDVLRPFTFTSLPTDDCIEFTIKTYALHKGVTNQLRSLKVGDTLIIHDVFGTITYRGPGIFMAGGAGITPFLAIFKDLEKKGALGGIKLLFANKKEEDIIQKEYFEKILGSRFINIISQEKNDLYEYGYISKALIHKHIEAGLPYYYLCGPDPMMDSIQQHLISLGVEDAYIIREKF